MIVLGQEQHLKSPAHCIGFLRRGRGQLRMVERDAAVGLSEPRDDGATLPLASCRSSRRFVLM